MYKLKLIFFIFFIAKYQSDEKDLLLTLQYEMLHNP
jgi:hypothetical protein